MNLRYRPSLIVALLALTLSAVSDGQTALVRDSSGVRIVQYARIPHDTVMFRVASVPYLDLGRPGLDLRSELDPRQAEYTLARLSDGSVVVNESHRLKYFNAGGFFLREGGRVGSGPGEFLQTKRVCALAGDTVLVLDNRGRLSIWDKEGRHLRTFADAGFVRPEGCTRDGRILVSAVAGPGRLTSRSRRDSLSIQRFDGTKRSFLFHLASSEVIGPLFYESSIHLANDRVVVAHARHFELRTYNLHGRLLQVTRVRTPTRALGEAEWRALIDQRIPVGNPEPMRSRLVARMMSERTADATLPVFQMTLLDEAGRLWMCDYLDPSRWIVFDAQGLYQGVVRLPWDARAHRARPIAAGKDHVVVRRYDDDGFVHLSFHRLHPV